ncbi:hypothetical protein [Terribacillus saccharophilus]|uniref:hypothetical protein n=1 Tax=Terribacillus saccharophilus TaxID=361277 RepID=UPI000C9A47F6|nr:hypothetical protein [Terribacillus goriensis]
MANRRLNLSKEGKDLLESIAVSLDIERVNAIKLSLAKGLASDNQDQIDTSSTPKWLIPDGIIKDKEFLMFKHLVIHKAGTVLNEDDIQKRMLFYIEKGIRVIHQDLKNKNSLDDSRFVIL